MASGADSTDVLAIADKEDGKTVQRKKQRGPEEESRNLACMIFIEDVVALQWHILTKIAKQSPFADAFGAMAVDCQLNSNI